MSSNQKGFTLIELMIAITLGLIISAAALMIFLSSQRSLAMQNGVSEIDQNTIFGLTRLTHDLRHINLDTGRETIHPTESGSGIIFEASQTSVPINNDDVSRVTPTNNTAYSLASDQLTIQYRARNNMTDCEGTVVPSDTLVVQKYYIDRLPNAQQTDTSNPRFGLYCDAVWNGGTAMGAGQVVVVPDAEAFKVAFATRALLDPTNNTDDTTFYQTLEDYTAGGAGDTVVALELGVVMRSSSNVHADRNIDASRSFRLAGQEVRLTNPPATASHLRVPINQVVAIRNSRGLE